MNERTIRAVCSAYGRLMEKNALYSHDTEGNFAYMRLSDKVWWAYKRYIRQVERAQRGNGIEEHFASQNLCFCAPDGFEETSSAVLSAGGDLMPKPFLTPEATRHAWDEAAGFYFDADIVYANLESPITFANASYTEPQGNATPRMSNSPEMLKTFYRDGKGITLLGTANNHCMDMGEEGLLGTLDALDALGCAHTGTARTQQERDDVLVLEKNGVRIAFLAYTFSLNGKTTPQDKPYMANYIRLNTPDVDLTPVRRDIEHARLRKGADFVVLLPHWSLEYELYPTKTVMDTARKLAALGADAIIGNHSHCIQPIERIPVKDPFTGRKKDCLVVYALGNLMDDAFVPGNWNLLNLVKLRVSKGMQGGEPAAYITQLTSMPLYSVCSMDGGRYADHRLLPLRALADSLRAGENPYGLNSEQTAEALRLEEIMLHTLGPALTTQGTPSGHSNIESAG